ncbi:MAG: hypothetical protein Q9181_007607 [Wetmoreana brouardii]
MADLTNPDATRVVNSAKEGHHALDIRKIPKKPVKYLLPSVHKDYSNDERLYDCWSKLTPFSLVEYERVVQLDSDMLAPQNMDELMDIELDSASSESRPGKRVFAASHACVCNPLKKPHYPDNWVPDNCAFTSQHSNPDTAQIEGAAPTAGLGMPNGGTQVVKPSQNLYNQILDSLTSSSAVEKYEFADQSLLSDIFWGRWVPLPYTYNALKTLRSQGVHSAIWRDDRVKNMHYILSPKPWDEKLGEESNETHTWWLKANKERISVEKERGIDDTF